MSPFSPMSFLFGQKLHHGLYLGLQRLRHRPIHACLRQIRAWERLGPADYAALCARQLEDALVYARQHVPLYRSGPWAAMRSSRRLADWPVLTREVVVREAEALLAQPQPAGVWFRSSSASTSAYPVRIAWHPQAAAWSWANEHRAMAWHGVQIGDRTLMLWGACDRAANLVLNRRFFSTRRLTVEELDAAARFAIAERPTLLWAFPSAAAQLARHVSMHYRHHELPLAHVAKLGGEQVYPFQRREIEQYLGAKPVQLYGSSELGAIAAECPLGSLHIYGPHVKVEVFRGDEPAPVGEFGDIVVTTLINRAMPLIRYRVGDQGRLSPEPCPCGLPHPVLADLRGRCDDHLLGADGTALHATAIGRAMEAYVGKPPLGTIRQVQFEQVDQRTWRVLAETDQPQNGPLEGQVRELLSRQFGCDCRVEITCVPFIPREPSGKHRYYRVARTN